MPFDGSLRHDQCLGYVSVTTSFRDQREDLLFSAGQRLQPGVLAESAYGEQLVDNLRVDDSPPSRNFPECSAQLAFVFHAILQEVPATSRALLEEGEGIEGIGMLAQDDDADGRMRAPELVRQPYALVSVARGHPDVCEHDVRQGLIYCLHQLVEARAARDELDPVGYLQGSTDALAGEVAVLAEYDPDHGSRRLTRPAARSLVGTHARYGRTVIATLPFGSTGHESTRTIFGAASLGSLSQSEADPTLELLLEHGVNHIDTAASYGDSELRLAPWLAQHRDRFFLATKTGERGYAAARDEIHRSLERLGVDHVDLVQLHNLVDVIEWETALREGGALEAVVEARAEGLVRFIGVTGHGLTVAHMHRRSLERFPFDSVLLPYSFVQMRDERYAADFEALTSLCAERGVAVQTIKAISLAPWDGREQTAATWYEPLLEQDDIDLAVHWVLGRPGVFLNTVGDVTLLPRVLDAAGRFESRPSDAEMDALTTRRELVPLFS